ncbi:Spx/MgsR family RNA polymerase-binding regulatory protein [Carnobacteriaceae bacterium zg-ZUI252]|nr:Spx/MgsR family RNA polymerase-binding regulatory protein [Carnobacteriaceae bacterium zg-ZUI252]QTU83584.1 Spx/MgsR family RNA polymerase-binding regulatory protein [Carnobacteriaceae bacterium zg-C25]
MTVYIHPTCSTCKKILKWLDDQGHVYETVDIRKTPPTKALLQTCLKNGVTRSSMMNTSGELYREMQLKDKLSAMSDDDVAGLLSKHGMLIKRPVIWYNDSVTFGAKEKTLEENWRK